MTALRQVSTQSLGSDTSSIEGVDPPCPSGDNSSSTSYQSMSALDDEDKTNPFLMDETDDTTDTVDGTDQSEGDSRSVTSVSSLSPASRLSSFTSSSPYTNPPVLRFNPKDMPKKPSRAKSAPPPSVVAGLKNAHKDVYSTAFALHSLGNGDTEVSEYMSKVRALWDGHNQQRPASSPIANSSATTNSSSGGSGCSLDNKRLLGSGLSLNNQQSLGSGVSLDNRRSLGSGVSLDNRRSLGSGVSLDNRRSLGQGQTV